MPAVEITPVVRAILGSNINMLADDVMYAKKNYEVKTIPSTKILDKIPSREEQIEILEKIFDCYTNGLSED